MKKLFVVKNEVKKEKSSQIWSKKRGVLSETALFPLSDRKNNFLR